MGRGEDARDEYIEMDVDFTMTASTKALAAANGAFTIPLSGVAASGGLLGWMNSSGVGGSYTGNWCYHKGGDRSLMRKQNRRRDDLAPQVRRPNAERATVCDAGMIKFVKILRCLLNLNGSGSAARALLKDLNL